MPTPCPRPTALTPREGTPGPRLRIAGPRTCRTPTRRIALRSAALLLPLSLSLALLTSSCSDRPAQDPSAGPDTHEEHDPGQDAEDEDSVEPSDTSDDTESEPDVAPDTAPNDDLNDTGEEDTGEEDIQPPHDSEDDAQQASEARGEHHFRSYCASCHTIGHGDLERGSDLLSVDLQPDAWLRQWLRDPAEVATWSRYAQILISRWGFVMPPSDLLSDEDIDDVIAFLHAQRARGALTPSPPLALDDAESAAMRDMYFDRCAGCHGTTRAGATGPDLRPERSTGLGTDTLAAAIRHGRPWGMPAFGRDETLSEEEILYLAAFLQQPVPEAPDLPLSAIHDNGSIEVPVAARPSAPQHGRDWENFTGVVLRDSGEVAFFDGDTHEEIARLNAGFATHILRMSTTGRRVAAVGRDGWIALIDLWMDPPTVVARSRGCWDARSVAFSVFGEHADRWLVQGCYWPPQFVVFDGETLEAVAVHDVRRAAVDTGEALDEVRVAAILASSHEAVWMLALKESGHVLFVDYGQEGFPITHELEAQRFLHDGGWDHTRRYFLLAANARNQMMVIDSHERRVVARIDVPPMPHPGRGANWMDPTYGPVAATVHIGAPTLTIYGADPEGHPEHAWQVVRSVALPSAGGLFLKTHPNSPWVILDMTLATDPARAREICAYHKAEARLDRCFAVADRGRAVHPEFNRDGSELWISVWHDEGEVVVLDADSLDVLRRLPGLPSPTGKFNVFNTAHEVY